MKNIIKLLCFIFFYNINASENNSKIETDTIKHDTHMQDSQFEVILKRFKHNNAYYEAVKSFFDVFFSKNKQEKYKIIKNSICPYNIIFLKNYYKHFHDTIEECDIPSNLCFSKSENMDQISHYIKLLLKAKDILCICIKSNFCEAKFMHICRIKIAIDDLNNFLHSEFLLKNPFVHKYNKITFINMQKFIEQKFGKKETQCLLPFIIFSRETSRELEDNCIKNTLNTNIDQVKQEQNEKINFDALENIDNKNIISSLEKYFKSDCRVNKLEEFAKYLEIIDRLFYILIRLNELQPVFEMTKCVDEKDILESENISYKEKFITSLCYIISIFSYNDEQELSETNITDIIFCDNMQKVSEIIQFFSFHMEFDKLKLSNEIIKKDSSLNESILNNMRDKISEIETILSNNEKLLKIIYNIIAEEYSIFYGYNYTGNIIREKIELEDMKIDSSSKTLACIRNFYADLYVKVRNSILEFVKNDEYFASLK